MYRIQIFYKGIIPYKYLEGEKTREFHDRVGLLILLLLVFHIITLNQAYLAIGVLYLILLGWSIVESKIEDETEVK